jgi:hypothetical protein
MSGRSGEPYVGPRPFETADRALFFGRTREANDLQSLIMFYRTVLLYAQSGAGKSSLINTSIIPGLQHAGYATLPVARVRGAPSENLKTAANVYVHNIQATMAAQLEARLEVGGVKLADFLKAAASSVGGEGPVLILDQFEELFTSYQERWPDREDLFRQIAEALDRIPTLRILFSMREEYIAELDPLVWFIPRGIDVRYRLELLRRKAAVSAVRGPARQCDVDFAAAEKLVSELSRINVEGRPEPIEGEYVEPVQLQIVCKRLWAHLPDDVTVITENDLEQFGDVSDALREFYLEVVKEAARRENYEEKLIHLGCAQFVTASGVRSMVDLDSKRGVVGRLPVRVADALVDQHFLRREARPGAFWYEISHDRLLQPVQEKKTKDEELRRLLQARERLEGTIKGWKGDFVEDPAILKDLETIKDELVLSDDELAFLGMASIATGIDIPAWIARLKKQVPQLLENILLRASAEQPADEPKLGTRSKQELEARKERSRQIRRNAAIALGQIESEPTDQALLRLALEDEGAEVREQAAVAIAQADRPALNEKMLARLTGGHRGRALVALARMRDESTIKRPRRNLLRRWRSIRAADRVPLALALAGVRLSRRWQMIVYVGVLAGFLAGLFCGVARVLPSTFGQTLVDEGQAFYLGAGAGLFRGMAGGLMWGGFTGVFLALGWILFKSREQYPSRRLATNLSFGTIGGILGGIGVVAEIWFMFGPESKVQIKWIHDIHHHTLAECIANTYYCLFYPALGPAFGGGMGLALAMLYASNKWQEFFQPHTDARQILNLKRTASQAVALGATYSVATGVLLYLSALYFVFGEHGLPLGRVLGETTSIFVGNIGGVVGILLGLLIMRVGVRIPPYAD